MAAASYLRGRFVCAKHKKWDSFRDRDDNEVAAGESLTVYVWTEADNDLCEVVPTKGQAVGDVLRLLEPFTFGAAVEIVSGVNTYGKYRGIFEVKRLEPAKA